MRIDWQKDTISGGYIAQIGDVTLGAFPEHTKTVKFTVRPARGTKWRAQCSVWEEETRTLRAFGADAYRDVQESPEAAKRLAEKVYDDAVASRSA